MFIYAEIVNHVIRSRVDKNTANRILHDIAILEHERRLKKIDEDIADEFARIAIEFHKYKDNEKGIRSAKRIDQIHAVDAIKHAFDI